MSELEKAGSFKTNKTKDIKPITKSRGQRLQQARKVPQAVVKVASYAGGKKSVGVVLKYVSREGDLHLEDENGLSLHGLEEINEVLDDWKKDFGQQKKTTKAKTKDGKEYEDRDAMHLILSTPKGSDRKASEKAVRAFAEKAFSNNHQYLFAVHDDTKSPHAHFVVKTRGHDGKYLRTNKEILHAWREEFATECIKQGIEVDSSSRLARGVGTRSTSLKLLKTIETLTEKGQKTKAEEKLVKSIQQDLKDSMEKGKIDLKPWEIKAKVITEIERRGFINEAKKAAAEAAMAANPEEKKRLENEAGVLLNYANSLQEPKSKRELVIGELMNRAGQQKQEIHKITFNHKEAHNDRPEYTRISHDHARRGQRAAVLYQSANEGLGRKEPPKPVTSLRDMPGINVVQRRPQDQVLLRTDARNSMGDGRLDSYTEMRREGVSDHGAQRELVKDDMINRVGRKPEKQKDIER